MNKSRFVVFLLMLLSLTSVDAAMDSYRFLHVTIETPYAIFLFLVAMILTPFFLMAILYWKFAGKKPDHADENKK